ncbi:MAG TPA: sigma-70 family RNA polymerase sigma factor [Tepidisphaeraceae bacterium]|nr:sigma-70 family RNA polymerase sigma factor [Tepidisphaeraceae bacterium]
MDDHALLSEFVNTGRPDALVELIQRYEPVIRASAMRQLGDAHLAQDITQSAMMVLMRKAPSIGRSTPIGPWLVRTTHYLAIDALRGESTRRRHERRAAQQRREICTAAGDTSIEPVLDRAINSLANKYRIVLVLRYLQGWSHLQIADELEMSNDAVRQRLSRALGMLRRALDRDGVCAEDLIPAALPLSSLIEHLQSASESRINPTWRFLQLKLLVAAGALAALAGGIVATNLALHRAPPAVSVVATPPPQLANMRPMSTVP